MLVFTGISLITKKPATHPETDIVKKIADVKPKTVYLRG